MHMGLNNRQSSRILFSVFLILFLIHPTWAQKKKLTYKQAFKGGSPRLTRSLPFIQGWLDDEHYLERISSGEGEERKTQLMKVNAQTGASEVYLDYKAYKEKLPKGFSIERPAGWTEDRQGVLFHQKDDLYYYNMKRDSFRQLTASKSSEKNPRFSPNGKFVAYTRDHNLYVTELETGLEYQLTTDGSETVYNGWASWVYYEEILGRGSRYAAFWWSPDSRKIAFLRFDDSPVPTFPLYRADGVHGELEVAHYPKSGDPNPWVKLGIIQIPDGEIVWVDCVEKADHYVAWPFWTPDSKELFFQWMNRGQDHLVIYSADPATGKKRLVHEEKQDSWVEFFENIYFFKDGSGFLIRSNVDGWSHLYHYDMKGKLVKQLTKGEWAVRNVSLVDEDDHVIYFTGSRNNSTETHLYRIQFNGKGLKTLTKSPGTHRCQLSPGGTYFIDRFSNLHTPTKIELFTTRGERIRELGDSRSDTADEYALGKVELFTIPSGDGYNLPARWILPPDFDETRKYPVIFQIYGGPAAGSVRNSFSGYRNHFLAQQGIILITVDHRGSGHFGKKGVALMHRNLGKWEMQDLITAVKWLREKPFIDPDRMGITGGSYGGYTTCMALTYGADYFTHGIAHYSVTDWKLYDTVYTERYMDTPDENPEGYKFGSVITHANKYKGKLLITHGTMDDNVHMQNTIQLIDSFEDLNKDFDLMLYPNSRHGIGYPKRNHSVRESTQFWFHHFLDQELVVD
jgi:dipeptidyl-peptidase-4